MAENGDIFLRAKRRTFSGLTEDVEREWQGPFCFIQAADPQLGLINDWRDGGDGVVWSEEVQLTQQTVGAVNKLRPRPRFMVLCGDLVHSMPGSPYKSGQEADLKRALEATDPSIPLVFVSGNHDLGNTPTPATVQQYCLNWGDDYFCFWVGGVLCLVLNSQLFYDSSLCPALKEAQDVWLNQQLHNCLMEPRPKHVLVFQHIPLYLKTPDEDDDYFNLQKDVRLRLLEKFKSAGVKAVFSGHYHRNAGGTHDGLDMVVSSAIGCQLGEDAHGVRVVVVTADAVLHRYYSLEQLAVQGMDLDFRKLLQQP
ncbi:unnamed protein product [Lota lota]